MVLAGLSRVLNRRVWAMLLVTPAILAHWHHRLVDRHWPDPRHRGRPLTDAGLQAIVVRLGRENPTWGYRRIAGEPAPTRITPSRRQLLRPRSGTPFNDTPSSAVSSRIPHRDLRFIRRRPPKTPQRVPNQRPDLDAFVSHRTRRARRTPAAARRASRSPEPLAAPRRHDRISGTHRPGSPRRGGRW